jgi:hypothetical protein
MSSYRQQLIENNFFRHHGHMDLEWVDGKEGGREKHIFVWIVTALLSGVPKRAGVST